MRLFEEVQARTAELERSAAAADGDGRRAESISRSTFDLQPVLETLVEFAARLCDADKGVIFKRDGDVYRWSANYGNPPEFESFREGQSRSTPDATVVVGRCALEAGSFRFPTCSPTRNTARRSCQKLGGYRTILCVPMLREGAPVGVFALTRAEVRDFHAEADRARRNLRRPGRYRHRECPPVR